jgi:glucose/arabinose dehydrogenase
MFPAEYRNAIFITRHGSWNRSKKIPIITFEHASS